MSNDLDTIKPIIANALQLEQMDRHAIMSRALRHGFTLRPQEGRADDLNEYVYSFAREVFEAGRKAASIEKKGVNQFQLRIILRAVQEFEISVGRAAECIEMLEAGRFSVADLPEVSEAFGFDDAPMEKYAELRAERDALAAKLAELEGQEPVAWAVMNSGVTESLARSENNARAVAAELQKRSNHSGEQASYRVMQLYARPIPAEPVNARLLEALKTAEAGLIWYQTEHPEHVDECDYEALHEIAKAIAAAEALGVTGPKRLTDEEICQIAANSRSVEVERFLPVQFARAIEAAVLGAQETKNGD